MSASHAESSAAFPQEPQIDRGALDDGIDLYDLFGSEEEFDLEDTAAQNACFSGQDLSYTQGRGAELRSCLFKRCSLRGIRWTRASFTDVVFENCDLSNARFTDCYFQRVRFVGCKAVGTDAVDARLRNVWFCDSNLRMLNLNGSKVSGVRFERCDLSESTLRMLQEMKRITFADCDLSRVELTGTRLNGIDLTTCDLNGIALTGTAELRGAYVTSAQAVQLSALLGVILKD